MINMTICWTQTVHLRVHRDLPALSGYGEAERHQCGKVTWGFLHWAPKETQQNAFNTFPLKLNRKAK